MGDNSSSNEITFIYALIDPRTKQIRYVGKSDNPHGRLVEHLREKGALDKNQWLYNLLREGQQPELRILEEVPLHPPYLWQEREQWWIIHLRKQGAQLTNVVYGGEDTLPRETLGYIPRHRKWKGHYKPNLACVQTLLDHLAAGWDDKVMDDYPVDTTSSSFPKLQCIESCTRLPTGTVIWGSSFNNHPEFNITWFCRCSITVPHTLSLGVFPIQVSANDRDRKAKIYPTEPGTYESYIWKEQTQDCLDAGCQVTVHHGFAWNEWTNLRGYYQNRSKVAHFVGQLNAIKVTNGFALLVALVPLFTIQTVLAPLTARRVAPSSIFPTGTPNPTGTSYIL